MLVRVLGLLTVCVALANCAGPSAIVSHATAEHTKRADLAFWGNYRPDHRQVASAASRRHVVIAKRETPTVIGSTFSNTNAAIDVGARASIEGRTSTDGSKTTLRDGRTVWFTPEWASHEKNEDERLNRVTHICRC